MIFQRLRRRITLSRLALLLSTSLLLNCTGSSSDYRNHVVVRVNRASLTAESFADLLSSRLKMFNALSAKDSAVVAQAKNAVIQDFVVQVVTQEWAAAQAIFVRKEQLDAEVEKIRKTYPDDLAFRTALADEGLPYNEWETRLKQTVLERLVLEELRKEIKPITSEAIQAYYQANKAQFQRPAAIRLRQVVVDTEANAEKIRKELLAGKSMASLATKFSITSEGTTGGDVGWIEKGQFEIFDAGFKMNVGQRSPVLKSPFGFHIYEVTEKRVAKTLTADEAKKTIEAALLADREQDVYSAWLEGQILKARVFKDDDFLRQIKVQTRSAK